MRTGEFHLAKEISDRLEYLIGRNEAVEAGHFRSEGKEKLKPGAGLGMHGRYLPPSTEPGGENLRRSFTRGVEFIRTELDYVLYACWPGETGTMSVMVPGVRTALSSLNDAARRGRFV